MLLPVVVWLLGNASAVAGSAACRCCHWQLLLLPFPGYLSQPTSPSQPWRLCSQVTRHKRCRVRITVADRAGVVPQEGHKVVLTGLMVSQFSVRLTTYESQVEVLHKATI